VARVANQNTQDLETDYFSDRSSMYAGNSRHVRAKSYAFRAKRSFVVDFQKDKETDRIQFPI
jgi:hypothetical protein